MISCEKDIKQKESIYGQGLMILCCALGSIDSDKDNVINSEIKTPWNSRASHSFFYILREKRIGFFLPPCNALYTFKLCVRKNMKLNKLYLIISQITNVNL